MKEGLHVLEKFTPILDIDGPLAGFDDELYRRCEAAGFAFADGVTSVETQKSRYLTDDITDKAHRRTARDWTEAEGWFRELPVVAGAQEGVDSMLSRGWDVYLCTKPLAANPTCRDEKAAWVGEHFPDLKEKLVITADKSIVRGHILLDDAIKLSWLETAYWTPVVFSAAYNGPGSQWERLPRWTWGDSLSILHTLGGFRGA